MSKIKILTFCFVFGMYFGEFYLCFPYFSGNVVLAFISVRMREEYLAVHVSLLAYPVLGGINQIFICKSDDFTHDPLLEFRGESLDSPVEENDMDDNADNHKENKNGDCNSEIQQYCRGQ